MDAKKRALPNGSCNFSNWCISDLVGIATVRNYIIFAIIFLFKF